MRTEARPHAHHRFLPTGVIDDWFKKLSSALYDRMMLDLVFFVLICNVRNYYKELTIYMSLPLPCQPDSISNFSCN